MIFWLHLVALAHPFSPVVGSLASPFIYQIGRASCHNTRASSHLALAS